MYLSRLDVIASSTEARSQNDFETSFNRHCEASSGQGLLCLAETSKALSRDPGVEQCSVTLALGSVLGKGEVSRKPKTDLQVHLVPGRSPVYEFKLVIRRNFHLAKSPGSPALNIRILTLEATVDQHTEITSDQSVSILQETDHLLHSAMSTIEKVCAAVPFPDVTFAPDVLTEAMLRTIRFLTPGARIKRTVLETRDDPKFGQRLSHATWQDELRPVAEPQRQSGHHLNEDSRDREGGSSAQSQAIDAQQSPVPSEAEFALPPAKLFGNRWRRKWDGML